MNYNEIFTKAYKEKKVLLTGHTGFKGAWMLAWLKQLGAEVKGYALAPEHDNDLYHLINGNTLCDSVIADIRNLEKLTAEVISFQPDFVFHLAAQPLVRRSYIMPLYTFEVNVTGTANVLETLKELSKKCTVVIITTDKVYENNETGQAYKENDKLGGYDPYSASKAAAEIVVSSYRNSFFNPVSYQQHYKALASARAGNVIGGGDRSQDRIIPDIIRGIEQNEEIIVRNPGSVRPWQFVLEPISGYLLLGAMLDQYPEALAEAWNFGPHPGDVLTVQEVVKKALKVFGKGSYRTPVQKDQPHEAGLLSLNNEKATSKLGWQPKLHAAEAIEYTVQWYKNVTAANASVYTADQINHYAGL